MSLYLGFYCIATLSEADYEGREREGYHVEINGRRTWLCSYDLEKAKRLLLDGLPEECRAYAVWT